PLRPDLPLPDLNGAAPMPVMAGPPVPGSGARARLDGGADDVVQRLRRLPAQGLADPVGRADQPRRIPGPALTDLRGELGALDTGDGLDHLEHALGGAGADAEDPDA